MIPTSDPFLPPPPPCAAGGSTSLPSWAPEPGRIRTVSLNNLNDIDPRNDPKANPNYPGRPPWEPKGTSWANATDYGGVVWAGDVGEMGTMMFWGGAGHAAVNALMWCGFDVASRQWRRIGRRPLPSDALVAYTTTGYPAAQWDAAWGDYVGGWAGWPAGFAQPGYNPPEGAHNYGSLVYRPAARAGNSRGEILYALNAMGTNTGTTCRGSWVWDGDTGLFTRSANLRPAAGQTCGGIEYFGNHDVAAALNSGATFPLGHVDVFDWRRRTWSRSRQSGPVTFSLGYNATSLKHEGTHLYIQCTPTAAAGKAGPYRFLACPLDKVLAGQPWSWVEIGVAPAAGASWPVPGGSFNPLYWCWHPGHGCWYTVDGNPGSTALWKLAPPPGATTQDAMLSGRWTVSSESLGGEPLYAKSQLGVDAPRWNWRSLAYVPALSSFLWMSDFTGGVVQAIRPRD